MPKLQYKRQIHAGYREWEKALEKDPTLKQKYPRIFKESMFAKWQYIYFIPDKDTKLQRFSLIKFCGDMMKMSYGVYLWEILFPDGDVRRFKSKKEAEQYLIDHYC